MSWRLLGALVRLGVLLLLTAGTAWAAGLTVPASQVGSGTGAVDAPPFKVTKVSWTLLGSNPLLLDKVALTFEKTGGGPKDWDAYIVIKDQAGNVLAVRQSHDLSISGNSGIQTIQFAVSPTSTVQVKDIAAIGVTICSHHPKQPHDYICR